MEEEAPVAGPSPALSSSGQPVGRAMPDDPVLRAHAEMRARVEAAPFAPSLGAFLDTAAAAHGAAPLWRFIEAPPDLPFRETSYAGLAEATRRVAAGLARRGVRPGERVGVMLPNIPAFPIAWLALARLGAVMIPVNTGYTARELDYVLGDGGASHLVVHEDALPPVLDLLAQRPVLDRERIHSWTASGSMSSAARRPACGTGSRCWKAMRPGLRAIRPASMTS
jgi:acyl-CoA synthetase (AMP-forming)/AMP-acid ligase II